MKYKAINSVKPQELLETMEDLLQLFKDEFGVELEFDAEVAGSPIMDALYLIAKAKGDLK